MTAASPPSHCIFLSGTNTDLGRYKEAAREIFGRLKLTFKVQQNYHQTGTRTGARQWSEALMAGTDWYVLIVANRYGALVEDPLTGESISVTEAEFRHALRSKATIFVLLSNAAEFTDAGALLANDKMLDGNQDVDKIKKLEAFRSSLTQDNTVVDFFIDLADFKIKLERMLSDALQVERDEWVKGNARQITEKFNTLLTRKADLLRRVRDLDGRFRLNQVRLNGVTRLKKMHDAIHTARQTAIRPLREITLPEWNKNGLSPTIAIQLKDARRVLRGLEMIRGFASDYNDGVREITAQGERFSDSRADLAAKLTAFLDTLVFADEIADYSDPLSLSNGLEPFVVVLEDTFALLSSELKLGAHMLREKNKVIEDEVKRASQDQKLGLSEADILVVTDRVRLLQVRSEDLYRAILGHDEWQWVHDRLNLLEHDSRSAGHAQQIGDALFGGGRLGVTLHELVRKRGDQLGLRVIATFTSEPPGSSPTWSEMLRQLRAIRKSSKQSRQRAARIPVESLYLQRRDCIHLLSQLAKLREISDQLIVSRMTLPQTVEGNTTLPQIIEGRYMAARKEFDDRFFDVDSELSLLCAELSKKVDESLSALRQIELEAN